ncbi:MAG: hypothetical protein LUG98_10240 [Tannerellaceae bacterium]|nr:hypothetical protein [Tannerellaceae bacterium]
MSIVNFHKKGKGLVVKHRWRLRGYAAGAVGLKVWLYKGWLPVTPPERKLEILLEFLVWELSFFALCLLVELLCLWVCMVHSGKPWAVHAWRITRICYFLIGYILFLAGHILFFSRYL